MQTPCAVLIGFQDQDNLGIGYLASILEARGYTAHIHDFREGSAALLRVVQAESPAIVGFSLIFQYYLPQFASMAAYLRAHGIDSHFCIGGHYPTVCFHEVLEAVPELDCVVLGEGELTIVELMERLVGAQDWHGIAGIAFREGNRCIVTAPRHLIEDLDELPYPVRPVLPISVVGKTACSLLASRGCCRACSFCSIREFYAHSPGKKVRIRDPLKVAQEMKFLHDARGASIFLFQDDDFPVYGASGARLVARFIEALETNGLVGRIIWKISCRADEINLPLFARMRDAGLYMVYMGLESGTPEGLMVLNKQLTVAGNLRAVTALRQLGLLLSYGFMLFDPSSTFESVRRNVAFLRTVCEDNRVAACFGRMLPYAGTPIECQLARDGRLRGGVVHPDYDFLDPRLNSYFELLNLLLTGWTHGPESLANMINSAWQECFVLRRLFSGVAGTEGYERHLQWITTRSNGHLFHLLDETSRAYERGDISMPDRDEVQQVVRDFKDELVLQRDSFILSNQQAVLTSLNVQDASCERAQPSDRLPLRCEMAG